MEKAGTGIKRVHDTCKKNGNKVVFEFSDAFWIRIYSNEKDVNVTDNVTGREQVIFDKIKQDNKITTTQLANQLNISKRTILRDIEKLKQQNKIKRTGDERTGYWEILS